MRRLGFILLGVGVALFLVATSLRGGYDSFEGSMRTTFSKSERGKRDFWGAAKGVGLVAAAGGAVLLVVGGRKGGA